ncbi:CsiV family protein [Paraglaciecola aquimarina]|uniref:CsiV family protein n=1 Tax=Paraglaciecola aquimarina TaxID=1235557 RepID=A0ABU3SYJ1_9ALTE|nr:CsiV family protein [Paraglaciecola aquimarina]MDU0355066.1 CsiV family protein [Paraglaciecola aquimarina]
MVVRCGSDPFARDLTSSPTAETFQQSSLLPASSEYTDIISPYLMPDLTFVRAGLAYCRESSLLAEERKQQQDFAFPAPIEQAGHEIDNQVTDDTENEQLTDQSPLDATETNHATEDNFDYQVVSSDIFAENPAQPTQASASADISGPETLGTMQLGQSIYDFPIKVDWIEWQLPRQFPCAYVEQVAPTPEFLIAPSLKKKTATTASGRTERTPNGLAFGEFTSRKDDAEGRDNPHSLQHISHVPLEINGVAWDDKSYAPYLLPKDTLVMEDLYLSLQKQRGIQPLVHLAWRQEVTFGADKAIGIRLFAGRNFAQRFDASGQPIAEQDNIVASKDQVTEEALYIPSEELALLSADERQALLTKNTTAVNETSSPTVDLFSKIEHALNQAAIDNSPLIKSKTADTDNIPTLQELWEVDGYIKVYLQNMGRVPYLHINSNLNYRHPVDIETPSIASTTALDAQQVRPPITSALQSVNFNQLRRVISKQVHYFDHPMFGMVVTINRSEWPEAPDEEVAEN